MFDSWQVLIHNLPVCPVPGIVPGPGPGPALVVRHKPVLG